VVAWPGLFGDSTVWHDVERRLHGRRRLLVDPPGHGRSDNLHGPFTVSECATALGQVVDELGPGPAIVAGQGWGAWTAISLAAERPDLVAGLLLVGGLPPRPAADGEAEARRLARRYQMFGMLGLAGPARDASLGPRARRDDALRRRFWAPYRASAGRVGIRFAIKSLLRDGEDLVPVVAGLNVPVAAVTGGADPACPPEEVRSVLATVPDLVCHRHLDGVGAFVQLEAPDQVVDVLGRLCARVEDG
jgi:3-oxoadipate enol-lactonase